MRLFKRLSIALLAAALSVTLAACAPNADNQDNNTDTDTNSTIDNSGTGTNTGTGTTGNNSGTGTDTGTGTGSNTDTDDSTDSPTSTPTETDENKGVCWECAIDLQTRTAELLYWIKTSEMPSGVVELPSSIKGFPITKINSNCMEGTLNVTGVIIPSTVTEIEDEAFAGTKIQSLTIPAGVTKVGKHVCGEINDTLEKVTLLGNAEYKDAFSNCEALKTVVIGSGVRTVSVYAFGSCDSLSSVTLCEGLTTIEERAFYGCKLLIHITFPSTLKEIGPSAFSRCRLQRVVVPEGVTKIGLFAFEEVDSSGDSTLKAIYLPSTLQEISNRAVYCYDKEYRSDGQPLHVYYGGSENDWNKVNIIVDIANQEQLGWALSHGNTCAEMHYNASPSNVG